MPRILTPAHHPAMECAGQEKMPCQKLAPKFYFYMFVKRCERSKSQVELLEHKSMLPPLCDGVWSQGVLNSRIFSSPILIGGRFLALSGFMLEYLKCKEVLNFRTSSPLHREWARLNHAAAGRILTLRFSRQLKLCSYAKEAWSKRTLAMDVQANLQWIT